MSDVLFSAAFRDLGHLREHIEEILPFAHEVGFDGVCPAGFHIRLTRKVVMNEVDLHIGSRIRGRRLLLRRSVEAVAHLAGLDDETLTAFEEGQQRVSAQAMVRLCDVLDMRPLDIFRGYPYGQGNSGGEPGAPKIALEAPDLSR